MKYPLMKLANQKRSKIRGNRAVLDYFYAS